VSGHSPADEREAHSPCTPRKHASFAPGTAGDASSDGGDADRASLGAGHSQVGRQRAFPWPMGSGWDGTGQVLGCRTQHMVHGRVRGPDPRFRV
jgi:hypothetical protein